MAMKRVTILIEEEALKKVDLSPMIKLFQEASSLSIEFAEVPVEVPVEVPKEIPNTETRNKRTKGYKRTIIRGTSTLHVIMAHYTPEGYFTKDIAKTWMAKTKYNVNSLPATLSKLVKAGYIERNYINGVVKLKFLKPMEGISQPLRVAS